MGNSEALNVSDADLLFRWLRDGERRAGNLLFERYFGQIQGYFLNAVGDGESRDLTQETFLRLTKSAARFAGRSTFRTFLFAIAHNVLRDHLRRRKVDFDPVADTLEDVEGLTPSRAVSAILRHHRLLACIRALPFESQQLLELYHWHGMTAADCEQILGIKAGTVRRRVHDIRLVLEAKLAEREPPRDLDQQIVDLAKLLFASGL